jgi:hypothetical protein
MSSVSITLVRSEALFASPLQRSEDPTAEQVDLAIEQAVRRWGSRGCAALVAQEFGDHPDTAAPRMRWACQQVAQAGGTGRGHGGTGAAHRIASAA